MYECEKENFSIVTKKYLEEYRAILCKMTEQMGNANLTGSISHNFIVQMIPHHRAAIEMARNLLQYTTFVPLQNIALNIIEEQTKSIGDLNAALPACQKRCNTMQEVDTYLCRYQQIAQTMFYKMDTACTTNNINISFMHEMIPHHKGAVELSETALQFCICPELTPILQSIISSQQAGIQKMNCLLRCCDRN